MRVYGPGVERGVKMNNQTYFTVDCREAGPGLIEYSIEVLVKDCGINQF